MVGPSLRPSLPLNALKLGIACRSLASNESFICVSRLSLFLKFLCLISSASFLRSIEEFAICSECTNGVYSEPAPKIINNLYRFFNFEHLILSIFAYTEEEKLRI